MFGAAPLGKWWEAYCRVNPLAFEEELRRRRAAEEQATLAKWQLEQARRNAIEEAESYASREGELTLLVRMDIRRVMDLANKAPAITIKWMPSTSHAREMTNGCSYRRLRTVVSPGLFTIKDALTVRHEIGHQRDQQSGSTLEHEIRAWRFAVDHSLVWNDEGFAFVRKCLKSYIDAATDPLGVLAAEKFLEELSERKGWTPTEADFIRFEQDLLAERYGIKHCHARWCYVNPRPRAVELIGSTFCCVNCRPLELANIDRQRQ